MAIIDAGGGVDRQGRPALLPSPRSIEYDAKMSQSKPVVSDLLAATISSIGMTSQFKELQLIMRAISEGEQYLHEFASGQFQAEISKALQFGTIGEEQHPALGTTQLESQRFGSIKNRDKINAYAIARDNISKALVLLESMQSWLSEMLKRTDTTGFKKNERQEPLVTWAFRVGAVLNPDIKNRTVIDLQSNVSRKAIDYHGLDNILDDIRFAVETLDNLAAYYRTGYDFSGSRSGVTMRVVYPMTNETIESIASRELGNPGMGTVLMDFNGLTHSDMMNDDWINTQIKIPLSVLAVADPNNMVLDSHVGAKTLGADLSNTLELNGGDLKPLQYTDTLAQALSNRIATQEGSLIDDKRYGTDIMRVATQIIPPIRTGLIGKEAEITILKDPRVNSVSETEVLQSGAALNISMQVETIDGVTEDQLLKFSEIL